MEITLISSIIILFILQICIYLTYKSWKFVNTLKKIPTPNEGLFCGNLLLYLMNVQNDGTKGNQFYKMREMNEKYYPIFRYSLFLITAVIILDPRDIEMILAPRKHLSKTFAYKFLHSWLGTGLLTSTGSKWHKRRKMLTPAFHFTVLLQFVEIFNEETKKLVEKLKKTDEQSINVIPYVTDFTLQSIEETAMGFKNFDQDDHKTYKKAVLEMGQLIVKRTEKIYNFVDIIYRFTSLWKTEQKLLSILHNFTNRIIHEKEMNSEPNEVKNKKMAMLDLLLLAKSRGEDIDYEGIREEVDTFMFEGHDTTSVAISHTFLVLANHPEIQEKVYQEISEILGPTLEPSFQDLQQLKYTELVIKETLRLYPSVPLITRFASEDFTTATGYQIPRGTILHIHIYDVHRNPNLYPNPLKFDPERFLPENSSIRHPFAFIPFSAGPRNCIGQRFAILELKSVLCGVLRNFRLKKVDSVEDIKFKADLVLRPDVPIRVKFERRT